MPLAPQASEPPADAYPVDIIARYPERSSRVLALLAILFLVKVVLLLPHLILLYVLSLAATVVMVIGYFAVLVLGHYPKGLWGFLLGVMRWQTRTNAWMIGLVDRYPPFSLK